MLTNIIKLFILLLFLNIQPVYSKILNNSDFKKKNLSNYFSALVSLENQQIKDSLKFFNSSKSLIHFHEPYLKKYVVSLVNDGKIKKAAFELKSKLNERNLNFFEAYLLLFIDSMKKDNFQESEKYLKIILKFEEMDPYANAISQSLNDYFFIFKNNQKKPLNENLGDLGFINLAFQSCYLGKDETENYFENLLNKTKLDYSRYLFFYTNYLIFEKKYKEAKELTDSVDIINSKLLSLQTKYWLDAKEYQKIQDIFSCKNKNDILSEFFYLIASLYSSESEYKKSNFYLNISNFLNPKFKFNLTLSAENFYANKKYTQSKIIIDKFNKEDGVYYWYKIKKNSQIILKNEGEKQSSNYLNVNFSKIKNPSEKILFDMGNLSKSFKNYEESIDYYNRILLKIKNNTLSYADLLYRRGGAYERLGEYSKSDKDLMKSLKIEPDNAYVLNYLAYSWLERNYKINDAMKMLEIAYEQEPDDAFIIDSIGWAYYLTGNYEKAEELLKKAIKIMPDDPIVNDHYGDILWNLNRKIEAKYYWESVLNFEDTEEEMKSNVYLKILQGLQNI